MKDKQLTGTINTGKEIITFVCEDFRFTFVRANNNLEPIKLPLTIPVDSSGYIWGTTCDGKPIAIFTNQDIVIYQTRVLNTWNYIIFKIPVNNKNALFDGIRFFGGGVNSINPSHSLSREWDIEDELRNKDQSRYFVYKAYDSTKKIDIKIGTDMTTWTFGNVINSKLSVDEGASLKDGASVLEILFDTMKSLTYLYDYYGYISTLVSFMTYRTNVFFEHVTLVERYGTESVIDIAECYIKVVDNAAVRKMMNSISVHFLSEDSLKSIVLNIAQVDKKHKYIPIDFLPENDSDFGVLTKDRLRNICSALEVEMDLAKISASKNKELDNLIDSIKKLIKKNRDSEETTIPENTYNNIFNSISHWGDSVADRAIIAWDKHKEEIAQMLSVMRIDKEADEIHRDIAKFINIRNRITHDGFNELDENLAETAILLSALVYCMSMTRFEIEKDKIKDLMGRRLIG